MGQSAEELRHEIAGTRAELGDTLDAIGDRVSPGRVIERRKNRMANSARSAKDWIFGTASDASSVVGDKAGSAVDTVRSAPDAARGQAQGNPLLAGAVAFGVGFAVASIFPASQVEEQAAAKALDKAEPLKQELSDAGREVADNLKDAATDAAHQVKSTVTEGGQEVAAAAKDAAQTSKDATREAVATARQDVAAS